MIDIVINYRTADEPLAALLIDQALTARIGDQVFRDNRAIPVGKQYPAEIWSAIQDCRILVAVIGVRWLERDEHGRRRIDDPKDYVRREIAEVLRRNALVVPVLVGDATLPDPAELPFDLRGLPLRQYRTLRLRGAEHDVTQLTEELLAILRVTTPVTERPAAGPGTEPSLPTASTTFNGPVDAPGSVFGVAVNYGWRSNEY